MSRKTKNGLLLLVAFGVYLLFVFCLYQVEVRDANSNIKSFEDALWYSIITLTTIGYGDRFPVTGAGRILAMVFVLGSVGILGFVISQISSKIYKYMEDKKLGYLGTKMENHVVLIHWNGFARQILTEIVNAEKKAVVITEKKEDVDYIYEHYDQKLVFVLHSDTLDEQTFQRSNLAQATTVLLNYEDDTDNLVNLITLKTPFPDLCYVISLNNPSLKKTFKQLGVTFTLAKNEVASKLIASYVFEPEVAKITEGLMSSSTSELDMGLMQFKIITGNPYIRSKGLDSFVDLKNKYNVILVGISKPSPANGEYALIKNPTNAHTIEENDYVIVLGNLKGKKELTTAFGVEEGL
ncbi:MAG: potassium channel family protein [Ferruginibacter sp.]